MTTQYDASAEKKPMLWLHGWGMSPNAWRDLAASLPGYDHHYIDYSGCRSVEDYPQTVLRALSGSGSAGSSADVKAPWTVIGWSLGGLLALDALMKTWEASRVEAERVKDAEGATPGFSSSGVMDFSPPYTIETTVIVSSTLRFVDRERSLGWPRRAVLRMQERLGKEQEQEAMLEAFRGSMLSPVEHSEGKLTEKDRLRLIPTDMSPEGLAAGLDYLMETDLTSRWTQFCKRSWQAGAGCGYNSDSPSLLSLSASPPMASALAGTLPEQPSRMLWIHGAADTVCPVGAMPSAEDGWLRTVVVPEAGHAVFRTEKQRFLDEIRSFLYGTEAGDQ